ncbi:hypothetical protein BU17DRAFT_95918 [Hysterangium stoloniferum]|nr:hypothetical protein BU17DRAFT_95918 [Hysterangium stoloniferum]
MKPSPQPGMVLDLGLSNMGPLAVGERTVMHVMRRITEGDVMWNRRGLGCVERDASGFWGDGDVQMCALLAIVASKELGTGPIRSRSPVGKLDCTCPCPCTRKDDEEYVLCNDAVDDVLLTDEIDVLLNDETDPVLFSAEAKPDLARIEVFSCPFGPIVLPPPGLPVPTAPAPAPEHHPSDSQDSQATTPSTPQDFAITQKVSFQASALRTSCSCVEICPVRAGSTYNRDTNYHVLRMQSV